MLGEVEDALLLKSVKLGLDRCTKNERYRTCLDEDGRRFPQQLKVVKKTS